MNIELIEQSSDIVFLRVEGCFDISRTNFLKKALLEIHREGGLLLVLDLGGVEYMDSSGVGALLHVHSELKKKNGSLYLSNLNEQVRSLMILTKLISFFNIFGTIEEAKSHFKQT